MHALAPAPARAFLCGCVSHQACRGAMSKFRDVKTLQKFASIHASIHNHFNLERHLNRRETFKENRAATMTDWRQLTV